MRNNLIVLALSFLAMVRPTITIADTGELRWGGDAEGGAPYVFLDPKNPREIIGFEVDLANALAGCGKIRFC